MRINEIFFSIQGEGINIGIPMVFVRVTGCNLRCRWCDTTYAFDEGTEMRIEEIVNKVEEFGVNRVCITGGEPLLHKDITKLITRFIDAGYFVQVQTNGSKTIQEMPCEENLCISMDIKCPSSGMQDKMNFDNIELLSPFDELKFVIADENDYNYALQVLEKYQPKTNIVFQPVYGTDIRMIADEVLNKKLNVRVLPQLHKYIWGDIRGK
ncbi:MAG: 7-carboxy-7-deazaguanine synthase QueE [Thermoplasmata archaeon]